MATEWRAPEPTERSWPDRLTGERTALEEWVDFHRLTLLRKCAGLTAAELRHRSVPPSNLSLLGLVRHMTGVERWWFRMHAAGEDVPFLYVTKERPDADFDDVETADAAADLTAFTEECDAARRAAAPLDLEAVVASRGDHPERTRNIRWIYLHMIEEYARHNGHADLLRELIDGTTGD